MLKKTQTLELINEFESKFSVETWEVDGLKIWPTIRIPLISEWEKEIYYSDGVLDSRPLSKYKRCLHEARLLFLSFVKSFSFFFKTNKADVGIWGLQEQRIVANGSYYSPFGDALRDLEKGSGLKFLCFELTFKRFVTSHYPCVDVSFGYHVSRFFSKVLVLLNYKRDLNIDFEACRQWCSHRKLPNSLFTKKYFLSSFYLTKLLQLQYKKIIAKYQLKICFVTTWYSYYGMALAWATKEQSIPCYDLQHGIAGASSSRVYSSWSRIPIEGYKLIPDGFWCWTHEDALSIQKWGSSQSPSIKTVVGGCVWQRLWLEEKEPRRIFSICTYAKRLINDTGIKILFTLQGNDPPEILFDLLKNSPPDWNWWIRCHPTKMDKLDEYEKLLSVSPAYVNVREASLAFLPLLLSKTKVHITGWSAVTYDALSAGLKSILVHPSAKQFFETLISSKQAFYLEDWKAIIAFIESNYNNLRFDRSISKYKSVKSLLN